MGFRDSTQDLATHVGLRHSELLIEHLDVQHTDTIRPVAQRKDRALAQVLQFLPPTRLHTHVLEHQLLEDRLVDSQQVELEIVGIAQVAQLDTERGDTHIEVTRTDMHATAVELHIERTVFAQEESNRISRTRSTTLDHTVPLIGKEKCVSRILHCTLK